MIKLTTQELLTKLNTELFETDFSIKKKSFLFKVFVPKGYIITMFSSIYLEDISQLTNATLLHESEHYIDRMVFKDGKFHRNYTKEIFFYLKYLFPQVLSIFSILSILSIWFSSFYLIFLIFLIFILPIPKLSTWRKNYELKGYYWNWYYMENFSFSKIFNSWGYYKMDSYHPEEYYDNIFRNMKKTELQKFIDKI